MVCKNCVCGLPHDTPKVIGETANDVLGPALFCCQRYTEIVRKKFGFCAGRCCWSDLLV